MVNNRLKEERLKNNDTLEKLQKKLKKEGVTVSTGQLSSYENGKRSPRNSEIWDKIAKIYNVSTNYLLGYSDNPLGALDDLAKELDQHLSHFEKEDIKKHPELTQHYLALAWDRMHLNSKDFKPVKINASNTALSDEELMKLPKEERQKYIKEQFKNLEVQIASVNEKLSELSKISTESLVKLSSEQLNRLTTYLIQALAKVNEVNKNN